jgi:galacturonosyltransferase
MNILLVSNSSKSIWLFRRNIILNLKKKGFNIYVFANSDDYKKKILSLPITFVPIKNNFNTTNILNFSKLFIELFLKVKKIRVDVIQSYTIVPNLICPIIAYFFKIKSVVMITGMGSIYISYPIFLQKFVDFIYKIVFRFVNHIIFVNNDNKIHFKKNILNKKIPHSLIYGAGVDVNFLLKKSKKIKRLSNLKNKFVITFVGRLIKDKGFYDVLDIFNKLNIKKKLLIVVGDVDFNNLSSINFKDNFLSKNTIYIKKTDSINQIYNFSDVLLFPSYGEGMPTVVMEAQTMGVPPIVYNVSGCRDVVQNNYNGFIFDVSKKDLIIKKIEELSLDKKLYNRISNNCIRSSDKYNQKYLIPKVISIYEELLK